MDSQADACIKLSHERTLAPVRTIFVAGSATATAGVVTSAVGGVAVLNATVNQSAGYNYGDKKPYANSRPSYAKDQVDQVWENAKKPDGKVYDPKTNKEITWDKTKPRNGQWDMGHKPDQQYKDLHDEYMNGSKNKEEFINEHRNSDNYRPELPSSNRSPKKD